MIYSRLSSMGRQCHVCHMPSHCRLKGMRLEAWYSLATTLCPHGTPVEKFARLLKFFGDGADDVTWGAPARRRYGNYCVSDELFDFISITHRITRNGCRIPRQCLFYAQHFHEGRFFLERRCLSSLLRDAIRFRVISSLSERDI